MKRVDSNQEVGDSTLAAVGETSAGGSGGSGQVETFLQKDSLDAELRDVARRVQQMEARGKRMEDLLLQLLEKQR